MDRRFLLLQLCFFISGFAALLYETAWTRELAFVFGTSELAVTAVLAAYMAGLALGAAIAARLAHRIRRPVLAYGVIELGIGLGALAVPFAIRGLMSIYVNWLGGLEAPPESVGLTTALFHLAGAFLVLVPCTALMGATLPLLARHAVHDDEQVGPRIGYLYAVNTAGAICGAITAAFVLLPEIGLRQTIYFGAFANALVFVAAALLSRYAPPADRAPARRSAGFSPVLPLIALSGAVSFTYEVLWVRLLGFILGGSTAAFATMLSSFLIGIALGSAFASRYARDMKRAASGFAFAQLGTALMAWLTFALADRIATVPVAMNASTAALLPGAGVAVLILLPVTLCVGASFPFAVRLMALNADDAASASARVYAWNTLGCIVGAVATGFWLLPVFGFEGALLIGALVNVLLAMAATGFFTSGTTRAVSVGVGALVALVLLVQRPAPPLGLIESVVFKSKAGQGELAFLEVGRSATVTLSRIPYAHQIATNGLPESVIQAASNPPDLYQEGRWLSLLPLLARPEVERVLIIGLGGGRTLASVPPTVKEIDLIELEPEVVEANREAVEMLGLPDPLEDPRLTLRIGDARGALMLTGRNYDAIISQPSHPWTSGASHLYTREFFSLIQERLAPGGVFVQWMGLSFVDAPLLRGLVGTLGAVFENVTVLRPGGAAILFISSDSELDFAKTSERAIAKAPESFETIGVHTFSDVAAAIRLEKEASRTFAANYPIITDDHNLLAWVAGRSPGYTGALGRAGKDLQLHDPLPELAALAPPGEFIRRMVVRGSEGRARAILPTLDQEARNTASGWLLVSKGRPLRAASFFEAALAENPESESALIGLAFSRGRPEDIERVSSAVQAVIEGESLVQRRNFQALSELDDLLAQSLPGSLLYPEATRLRVAWRLGLGTPQYAEEALALVEVLSARDRKVDELLLRAEAAQKAGKTEYAWASLSRIAGSLQRNRKSKILAREALRLASEIPPDEYAPVTLQRLRRFAQ